MDLIAEDDALEIFPDLPVVWQKRHFGEITHIFSHLKWRPFILRQKTGRAHVTRQRMGSKRILSKLCFPKTSAEIGGSIKEISETR